jgi:hypothetical protein
MASRMFLRAVAKQAIRMARMPDAYTELIDATIQHL